MTSAADGQARQTAAVFRRSDRVLFDAESIVWTAAASKHGAEYRRQWRKVHLSIDSVTGDGAYDTKECHHAIAQREARAIIPPRKNAGHWEGQHKGDEVRNAASKACRDMGHKRWKQQSHYHRRSLVETKMHGFKRLGERLMARTFERQTTEVHIRVAILNRLTRMGRPQTVAAV